MSDRRPYDTSESAPHTGAAINCSRIGRPAVRGFDFGPAATGTVGDEASDLQICAASVMGTWAVLDTASAAFVAGDEDGGILFAAVDIAAPLIATILTTPATKDGEPFFAAPVSGKDSDVLGFIAWIFCATPKGADYAGAVLNNMPTIAGAGLTNVVKEANAGVSVVVTMALILICGEIGAAVYGVDG